MNKIKYTLSALVASLALALGVAMPVGASSDGPPRVPTNNSCVDDSCNTKTTDNSKTITLGDCSIYGDVDQKVKQDNHDADAEGGDGGNGSNAAGGAGGAGGSASQSNTGSNNITLTCTTNNVTNAAAPQVLAAQVEAPKGGVSAGAGGAVASSAGSIAGLVGSLTAAGAGLVTRRKFNS